MWENNQIWGKCMKYGEKNNQKCKRFHFKNIVNSS